MIKLTTIASDLRTNAMLCSSAVALLAATASVFVPATASAQTADAFQVLGYNGEAAGNVSATDTEVTPAATTGSRRGKRPAPASPPAPSPAEPIVTPATAYNYYVSPNGNDSADGSKAAPFRTLARAVKAVRPSSTVWVAPGTYSGGFRNTVSGTSNGRIYFVSTTKWGAKIVPPASSSGDVAFDNRGSYVDIIGFQVDGSNSQSGTKWRYGIYNGGSYDSIRENYVHHIAKDIPCTSGGGSAIGADSYYKGVKAEIISNVVHDIGPAGCHFVQGIYMSTSGIIKNNAVYRVAEAAIHLWHDANDVIITNNTVTSSGTGIIVGGGDYYFTTAGANNVHVYSNIVYDNKYGISEQGRTGTSNTYRNNLVYQNTYPWTLKNGLKHYNTVAAVPGFTAYSRTGTQNLKITSGSAAVGKGSSTYAHPTDIVGRPRNSSTGFDIGAYQH
ncbi:DUF1565 domain-containing protein [Massilia soli]|uniref:DUF1565 domain-containing protein n=1 Tax=Massilia soli TaxID=2792854 RepID=A0ABS7SNV0_9BURK|nr:DUF1565 domain-containing protein [Massilia soli]MBZ2207485.1 DUF1565 domain-containing protein [Massilia soli]